MQQPTLPSLLPSSSPWHRHVYRHKGVSTTMQSGSHPVLSTLNNWEVETESFGLLLHLLSYETCWERRTELPAQGAGLTLEFNNTTEGCPSLQPGSTRDVQRMAFSLPQHHVGSQRLFHRSILGHDKSHHWQVPHCRYSLSCPTHQSIKNWRQGREFQACARELCDTSLCCLRSLLLPLPVLVEPWELR